MVLFDRWTSSINNTKRHEEAGAKMLGIKLCKIMHNCINGWDSSTPAMKIVLLKVDNVLLTNYYSRPIISRFTWGELVCGNFSRPSLMHTCFFFIYSCMVNTGPWQEFVRNNDALARFARKFLKRIKEVCCFAFFF